MNALPINPSLPDGFYNTPNEERSESELLTWWDKPFAIKREDGTYDVRCLDGGAWDRPTAYGVTETIQEAEELARAKLADWQKIRARPAVRIGDGGEITVVVMPQSPLDEIKILGEFESIEKASDFIKNTPNPVPK